MGMTCRPMGSQTDHHARMLNGLIRIVKFGSHGPYILSLGIHQKLFHPVYGNDFRVVI